MRIKSESRPNPRKWDLQDVENWFETEGGVGSKWGWILFTQKDREPLEKICMALKEAGIEICPITWKGSAFQIQLRIVESAKFVKVMKGRVKTAKARADMELAEKVLGTPLSRLTKRRRRVLEILSDPT